MALRISEDNDNKIDEAYRDGHGAAKLGGAKDGKDSLSPREQAEFDQIAAGSRDDIKNAEESARAPQAGSFINNVSSPQTEKSGLTNKIKTLFKKKSALVSVFAMFGVTGGIAATILGPASMIINITENLSIENDTSSTAVERRLHRVLNKMMNGDLADLCKNGKKMKCAGSRISNSGLRRLAKAGILPIDSSTSSPLAAKDIKKTGYPNNNPTHYMINGETVEAKNLKNFLLKKENKKLAAKVYGRSGAFALRSKAWATKHISKKFFNKFNIKRNGGLADGVKKKGKNVLAEAKAQLKEKIPGMKAAESIVGDIKTRATNQLGKFKKGGTAYLIGVAGCFSLKAPRMVASGVAAIQLAQIMPIVMDVILSPGSKAKAAGLGSDFNQFDAEKVGSVLTSKGPNKDGKMTSALDSPYLLYKLGVNKVKPSLSSIKDYVPGYSIINNGFVHTTNDISNQAAVQKSCDVLMSPQAMYAAMAGDYIATIVSSGTIFGGIIKIAAGELVSYLAMKGIESLIENFAMKWITDIAESDLIPKAENEAFGTVAALSADAFFSGGASANHLPTLTVAQAGQATALMQENEQMQKEYDIASLSPFDTSSRYTFLGSIVNNINMTSLSAGLYNNNLTSIISTIMRFPTTALASLSGDLNASNQSIDCYTDDFNIDTGDDTTTPCLGISGVPQSALTDDINSIEPEEAVSLMIQSGWINKEFLECEDGGPCDDSGKEISDDWLTQDLLDNGVIKEDSPLAEFINSCSNIDEGDYLFNASGCTTALSNSGGKSAGDLTLDDLGVEVKEDSENEYGNIEEVDANLEDYQPSEFTKEVNSERALAAIPIFLMDWNLTRTINGENDIDSGNSSSTSETVNGTKKELAQKIVASDKVTMASDVQSHIEYIAETGKGDDWSCDLASQGCGININILRVIATISEKHSIHISSLNRARISSTVGGVSSVESLHYNGNGSAVDISIVDGIPTDGRDAGAQNIIKLIMPLLEEAASKSNGKKSGIGQSQCGSLNGITLGPGVNEFTDSCNHLHIDVPPASDPALKIGGSHW